jgi:hypothetical protein
MASRSSNNTNTSQELVIYERMTWNIMDAEEVIYRRSPRVCNSTAWITQLIAPLQSAEDNVIVLAEVSKEEHVMEIDIGEMRNSYETISKNVLELCSDITQNQSCESGLAIECSNDILRDWLIFDYQNWTPISGL